MASFLDPSATPMTRSEPNPVQAVLRQAMGIESFPFDGDATQVTEPWQDRPHLAKTPSR